TEPATQPHGCLSVSAFHGRGAVVSPDGRWLYSFGGYDASSTVRVFRRTGRTGLIVPVTGAKGCLRLYWAARQCMSMEINKPTSAAVSPDRRVVFLTGY